MRLAYSNLVDDLDASTLTALSETTGYEITQVQDQRLTTVWKSSSAASQTVVAELDTFPLYPDSSTGTSYIQTAWSTVDSWTATRATLSVTNYTGILTVTATSNSSAYITRTGLTIPASSTIKINARSTLSSTLTILNSAGSTVGAITGVNSAYSILNVTTATAATTLNIYTNNSTVGTALEVDGIYTGDGTYTTQLTDLSGNGNHGTVVGCTPGDDGELIFTATGSRVQLPLMSSMVSKAFWVHAVAEIGASTVSRRIMSCSWAGGTNGFILWNTATQGSIQFGLSVASVQSVTTLSGLSDGEHTFDMAYDGNTTLNLYVDGVYRATATVDSAWIPPATAVFIGDHSGTLTNPWPTYIKHPRIFNRALEAYEVENLNNGVHWATEHDGLVGEWDLNNGLGVNTVAMLGHNVNTGTSVRIQGNWSNNWDDPEFDEQIVVRPDVSMLFLDNTYTYKYWRFAFGSQGDLEIGRLWLGEYLQIDPSSLNSFSVVKKRSDNVIHGKNRQKWAVPGIGWRRFELSFPRTSEAMIYRLSQMYDEVGNHSSLIFCNFDDLVKYELVRPCYVSIDGDIGFSHTKRQKYEWSLNLEEEK